MTRISGMQLVRSPCSLRTDSALAKSDLQSATVGSKRSKRLLSTPAERGESTRVGAPDSFSSSLYSSHLHYQTFLSLSPLISIHPFPKHSFITISLFLSLSFVCTLSLSSYRHLSTSPFHLYPSIHLSLSHSLSLHLPRPPLVSIWAFIHKKTAQGGSITRLPRPDVSLPQGAFRPIAPKIL